MTLAGTAVPPRAFVLHPATATFAYPAGDNLTVRSTSTDWSAEYRFCRSPASPSKRAIPQGFLAFHPTGRWVLWLTGDDRSAVLVAVEWPPAGRR